MALQVLMQEHNKDTSQSSRKKKEIKENNIAIFKRCHLCLRLTGFHLNLGKKADVCSGIKCDTAEHFDKSTMMKCAKIN